ncbi:M35 family metallopeptidase [Variovorax sp. GB1P17]|uniref:M35 family metallopeptidase n=1 Tax=Variovorax sp. GB1P17 TaxID=3443740 RepID=UPI003F47F90C
MLELRVNADAADAALSTSLAFSLTNTGSDTVHFLYWMTPFDPLCPAGLVVEAQGLGPAGYRGAQAKYSFDPQTSLISLAPGETVRAVVNVAENYALAADGVYRVSLREQTFRGVVGALPEDLAPCKMAAIPVALESGSHRLSPVDTSHLFPAAQAVNAAIPPHCTAPLCMGDAYYDEPVYCVMGRAVYGQARVEKGSDGQREVVLAAMLRLLQRMMARIDVRDDANYRRWFGTYTPERATQVTRLIGGVKGQSLCKNFVIYVVAQGPKPDVIAFFRKSSEQGRNDLLAVCPPFFQEAESGKDSRAGTLAHEISHGYSDSLDHEYGVECCQRLARLRPDLAVANADSLQYYLEDTLLALAPETS